MLNVMYFSLEEYIYWSHCYDYLFIECVNVSSTFIFCVHTIITAFAQGINKRNHYCSEYSRNSIKVPYNFFAFVAHFCELEWFCV